MVESRRLSRFIIFRLVVVSIIFASTTFLFYQDPITFSRGAFHGTQILSALTAALSLSVLLVAKYFPQFNRSIIYLLLVWDIHYATVLLVITGGIISPYSFLYLIIIIGVSISLSRRESLLCASLCSILYGALIDLQFFGKLEGIGLSQSLASQFATPYIFYTIFINMVAFFLAAVLSGHLAARVHRSERALAKKEVDYEELERLHSAIVTNLDSGLVTVNSLGRIRVMNRYAAELAGTSQEDAYDAELAEVMPLFSGIALAEGPLAREELSFIDLQGERRIYGYRVVPLMNRLGEQEGFIVNFKDLTAIKLLEERLLQADRLAAIGELAARIAHEIRNPLTAISGSVQLISQGDKVDQRDLKLFQIVLREAERLNGLVTEFLSYAKPNQPTICQIAVATFLTEFAEIARQDERLRHLGIFVACASDLLGSFDPALLQQVLWNLALNACGAIAGSGEIRFSARHAISPYGQGGGIVIDVADTGSGVAEEHLPHLFEPFYTTKVGGTGLGLATVYRIIEAHHGKIDVSRNQGMTTFSIWLPIVAE